MMRCFSIPLFGLLLLPALTVAAAAEERENDSDTHAATVTAAVRGGRGNLMKTLESSVLMGKLDHVIDNEKQQKQQRFSMMDGINFFRQLQVAEEQQEEQLLFATPDKMSDSSKQVLIDFTAAQQGDDNVDAMNMEAVAWHLKSAIAEMHSIMTEQDQQQEQHDGSRNNNNARDRQLRDLSDEKRQPIISGTAFQDALTGVTKTDVKNTNDKDSLMSLSRRDAAIVKQGFQNVITKLHDALRDIETAQEMQDLGERLVRDRKGAKMAQVVDNPATAVFVAPAILARFLDNDDDKTGIGANSVIKNREEDDEDIALEEILALIWIMPVSIVAGTFFWAVAGRWTYDDIMSPFQIWIFEIVWVSRVIGCVIENDLLCTI